MFAILIVFIFVVIGVIWLFQVKLLYVFYKDAKFSELESTAQAIMACTDDETALENVVLGSANEYSSAILVFKIEDNVAIGIMDAGVVTDSLMPFISKKDLQMLYDSAVQNYGKYVATVSSDNLSDGLTPEKFGNTEAKASDFLSFNTDKIISAVDVRTFVSGGNEYFIIQTADLTPVQATVKTLNRQFIWIGAILCLLALGLAAVMSRFITKPIVRMNESARKLAQGKYDADFSGQGYREICELSDTLNYASDELAKTDKLRRELISNISHDLRTPLTMIKGYSEVMRDIPGENTPENVQVIIDETERLTNLVSDMLDISKLQAGTRKPEMTVFSLTDTVRETMTRYERLKKQDGYRIEFKAEGNVDVYADSVMILQVIYNLINNAVNYTGEDKYVLVAQTVTDNTVRISVTDTGDGIEKDQIPLIWDRYYKVDRVHKMAAVGTGLGLSIVKEILELHGAQFGVTSTVGYGSTFWFELPVYKEKD